LTTAADGKAYATSLYNLDAILAVGYRVRSPRGSQSRRWATTVLRELAEVRSMPQRNLAIELLQKLLKGEIRIRSRRNVVQARAFSEMLEQSLRRYQNRAIEPAKIIEELIHVAKDIRQAAERGEALGLSDDEVAFCDALETNDKRGQGSR
jgi:type I site-specific restriction-modification system R (restriction) subunit